MDSRFRKVPPIVLLVDDSPICLRVLKRHFESLGYKVDVAGDGKVALDMAKNKVYDCVFMDLDMPEMNGYDSAKKLRSWERLVRNSVAQPICALTSEVTESTLAQMNRALRMSPEDDEELKGKLSIVMGKDKDELVIAFQDTGQGMSEQTIEHIFEPFFTTKAEGEGTGLGMSISYGIIERHKGRIAVNSEIGKGSVIEVRLPLK